MENGSCNLGSINFNAFVKKEFTDEAFFDLERFREVVKHMTWGLDELLTLLGQRHALPEQIEHVIDWREIGLGNMGIADMALSMGFGYGSDEFIKFLDTIMREMLRRKHLLYVQETLDHSKNTTTKKFQNRNSSKMSIQKKQKKWLRNMAYATREFFLLLQLEVLVMFLELAAG